MENSKNGNTTELEAKILNFQHFISGLNESKTELAEMKEMKKKLKEISPDKFITIGADLHTKISIKSLIDNGIDSNIELLKTQIAEKEASLKDFFGLHD